MPKYSFECSCGLTFTRTLKMGDYKSLECPNCSGEAARIFEGFGFDFARSPSAAPANTGVAKHDYPTADQAVGGDADRRWSEYQAREKVKEEVRKVGGNRALIRRTTKDYVEYSTGGNVVEARKKISKELSDVMKRPPS